MQRGRRFPAVPLFAECSLSDPRRRHRLAGLQRHGIFLEAVVPDYHPVEFIARLGVLVGLARVVLEVLCPAEEDGVVPPVVARGPIPQQSPWGSEKSAMVVVAASVMPLARGASVPL